MSARYLIDVWVQKAKLFRSAQNDLDRGDEEWLLNKIEADRLEQCAAELAAYYAAFPS